jgi:CBS domain-containing protein
MRVGELCTRSVVTCLREASGLEIAQKMREHHVGDLVVVDEEDGALRPVGVVTDRDLVVQVIAKGLDPGRLRAEDLLTGSLVTAYESELVHDAVWHMRGNGLRRLPIVDQQEHLFGMLTVDDVARYLAEELADLIGVASAQRRREQARLDAPGTRTSSAA